MRDDEFNRKLTEVEDIIDRLNQGDITLEEGERLKRKAMGLLDELETVLDQRGGETVIVEMVGEEYVEENLQL